MHHCSSHFFDIDYFSSRPKENIIADIDYGHYYEPSWWWNIRIAPQMTIGAGFHYYIRHDTHYDWLFSAITLFIISLFIIIIFQTFRCFDATRKWWYFVNIDYFSSRRDIFTFFHYADDIDIYRRCCKISFRGFFDFHYFSSSLFHFCSATFSERWFRRRWLGHKIFSLIISATLIIDIETLLLYWWVSRCFDVEWAKTFFSLIDFIDYYETFVDISHFRCNT